MTVDERGALGTLTETFRIFAEVDFKGSSPLYERLARESADDPEILSLLRPAAPSDRLPHLLFAAIQYLLLGDGSDPISAFAADPIPAFRAWCSPRRSEIAALVASRFTQTNQV